MAGDMGDEILGGYPKYWKIKRDLSSYDLKPKNWGDIINRWMLRIKRPITHPNSGLKTWLFKDKNTIGEELLKCYPDDLWNPEDPVGSYMALDCVTQVPEEFFNRNDKYGMAYGMEGRFPLATKTFMQYCMNIHSTFKIGTGKGDTKLLTKIAYDGKLPDIIINKMKTGWTVPLQQWWGKSNKADIPAMIVKDWIKTYKIKI
jgi:asparagine synthetase B (glutamine-hydrolysing)